MRPWIAAVAVLAWSGSANAMPPGEAGRALVRAAQAITELQLADAERELATIPERYGTDPDVQATSGMLALHRGRYSEAHSLMQSALRTRPSQQEWSSLAALMESTAQATDGYEELSSADGRYVVAYQPGRDSFIAPYALEALQVADRALTTALGHRHPGPIRLEIYPAAETLAAVSSLTLEAIETSGTIALCKWDRLMITSPRALVRGYPWVDTIGHELVHLVLAHATRDRAPVWMQEGMAKFFERLWRGDAPASHLDPVSRHLLAQAARTNQLLPFERLHPSIALLPSQQDAALAFAQVATFVERFHSRRGAEGLRDVIHRVREGADARNAFAAAAAASFEELEQDWQSSLRSLPAEANAPAPLARRLRSESRVDDTQEIAQDQARRFVRLADILYARQRYRAAGVEYQRAHRLMPDHPIIATRLARASLRAGDGAQAAAAIQRVLDRYPEHAPAYAVLSAAHRLAGDREGARSAAREAIWINPFDPEPQCVLSEVTDDDEERRRAAQACQQLGGSEVQ